MKSLLFQYIALLMVGMLGSSFLIKQKYNLPYPYSLDNIVEFQPHVNRTHLESIEANKPQVVLIGDSVLADGLDENALAESLGMGVHKIAVPGSGSATWYLILKNVIVNSGEKPSHVLILFSNTTLTVPDFRISGYYRGNLDEYARAKEPLVRQVAFIDPLTPLEKAAEVYMPLYSARWLIHEDLDATLRYSLPAKYMNCGKECLNETMDVAFGIKALDALAINQDINYFGALYTSYHLRFERRVDDSFLPIMIQLAKANDLNLIFVRMKNTVYPEYASETPKIHAYFSDLEAYLNAQANIQYIDLSHDERILNSYFVDRVHLNEEGRDAFTQILADELKPLISEAAAP